MSGSSVAQARGGEGVPPPRRLLASTVGADLFDLRGGQAEPFEEALVAFWMALLKEGMPFHHGFFVEANLEEQLLELVHGHFRTHGFPLLSGWFDLYRGPEEPRRNQG